MIEYCSVFIFREYLFMVEVFLRLIKMRVENGVCQGIGLW